jgi:hypothetical protein
MADASALTCGSLSVSPNWLDCLIERHGNTRRGRVFALRFDNRDWLDGDIALLALELFEQSPLPLGPGTDVLFCAFLIHERTQRDRVETHLATLKPTGSQRKACAGYLHLVK